MVALAVVTAPPRRFGCPFPTTLQLESVGTGLGGGLGPGTAGCEQVAAAASARRLLHCQSRRGGGERQPVPKKRGSRFLPSRHPLAGHQLVLEGRVSGGRGSHYRVASPLHFCPCVPVTEIRLRDLHKAPAIYYSAAP